MKFEINSIHNICCLSGLKKMDDNQIDLVVTSPPYDDMREYHNNSKWSYNLFCKIAVEMTRVLKPGGVIVWNVNDQVVDGSETGSSFRQALFFKDKCGLNIHDTMIYEKTGVAFASGVKSVRYTQKFEYVFILSKGRPKSINLICDKPNKWSGHSSWGNVSSRGVDGEIKKFDKKTKVIRPLGVRNNIWLIKNSGGFGQKNKDAYKHPATMPEELARDHIISWSNSGDLVFDPFLGSGTTACAAKLLNRNYLGFEIDKEYFLLAKNMIKNTKKEII